MTLTQFFYLRNLPCFTFSQYFQWTLLSCDYVFPTLSLPLAKRFQMAKFNLFYQNYLFYSCPYFPGVIPVPFKRGAKLRSFFNLPKVFLTFFSIPFVCNGSICLYLFYTPFRTFPVSRSANSSFSPIYFQATLPFLAAAKVIAFFIFPNTFKSILNFYPRPYSIYSSFNSPASLPSCHALRSKRLQI